MSGSNPKRSPRSRREYVEWGIYERTRADGAVVYELCLRINGRLKKKTLPVGTTLAQARKARTKMAAERDAGTSPFAVRDDPRLTEAAKLAIEAMRRRTKLTGKGRVSERTPDDYEQRLRDHVLPLLGHRKLSTLRKQDVLNLIDDVRAQGRKEWTVHHVVTALRFVLREARENDLMAHDPFLGIPSDRLPEQKATEEQRVIRGEDVNVLLADVADGLCGVRDLAAATVSSDCGLRTSELCGLRWRHVSFTDALISVQGQLARGRRGESDRIVPTKSDAGVRVAPLTPRAKARLEALYAAERQAGRGGDDDFVFTTRSGRALNPRNFARTMKRVARAAGLGDVTPKVLRRSVATAYAIAGVEEHVAAAITGHSPAVYRQHYVKPHRDARERENAMKRLLASGYGAD